MVHASDRDTDSKSRELLVVNTSTLVMYLQRGKSLFTSIYVDIYTTFYWPANALFVALPAHLNWCDFSNPSQQNRRLSIGETRFAFDRFVLSVASLVYLQLCPTRSLTFTNSGLLGQGRKIILSLKVPILGEHSPTGFWKTISGIVYCFFLCFFLPVVSYIATFHNAYC